MCQIAVRFFKQLGLGTGRGALASRQFRGYGRDMILSPALKRVALVAFTVAGLGSTVLAQGQDPIPLGKFGDWAAYTYKTASGKVCYVVSSPQGSEPKNAKRDPIFFLITHRPQQNVRNEVSTIIGYPFKKDATVQLMVDDQGYQLFTNGDGAWADTSAKDKEIVTALRKGQKLSVKGVSWRGTETLDTYSLKGVRAAIDKIDESCK
jgi:Invasion associated locus B (IalB) protein